MLRDSSRRVVTGGGGGQRLGSGEWRGAPPGAWQRFILYLVMKAQEFHFPGNVSHFTIKIV